MIGNPKQISLINHLSDHLSKRILLVAIIVVTGAIAAIGLQATSTVYKNDSSKPALYSTNTSKTDIKMSTLPETSSQPLKHATTAVIQTNSSESNHGSSAKVTVNGQNIPVPINGSVSKTINAPDGTKSTVNIYSSNSSTGGVSSSSSSTSLTVNMNSSSTVTSN